VEPGPDHRQYVGRSNDALPHGAQALSLARESHDQELEARSLSLLGYIHILGGDFEEPCTVSKRPWRCMQHFARADLFAGAFTCHYLSGAPLTQSLTNRASEPGAGRLLAFAQVHAGQVQPSIYSGRRALARSLESKNVWVHINSMRYLTYGLLDAGAYEEALGLMQDAIRWRGPFLQRSFSSAFSLV